MEDRFPCTGISFLPVFVIWSNVQVIHPFVIGILHTEIAKVTKTDLQLDEPAIGGLARSFVIFAISVWKAFSDRILHTEIAKVAKTDLELDQPAIGGRSVPL